MTEVGGSQEARHPQIPGDGEAVSDAGAVTLQELVGSLVALRLLDGLDMQQAASTPANRVRLVTTKLLLAHTIHTDPSRTEPTSDRITNRSASPPEVVINHEADSLANSSAVSFLHSFLNIDRATLQAIDITQSQASLFTATVLRSYTRLYCFDPQFAEMHKSAVRDFVAGISDIKSMLNQSGPLEVHSESTLRNARITLIKRFRERGFPPSALRATFRTFLTPTQQSSWDAQYPASEADNLATEQLLMDDIPNWRALQFFKKSIGDDLPPDITQAQIEIIAEALLKLVNATELQKASIALHVKGEMDDTINQQLFMASAELLRHRFFLKLRKHSGFTPEYRRKLLSYARHQAQQVHGFTESQD